jgi:small-conductance mechanosensitive channel
MQKLVTGSFLAAVAVFIFGPVYWTSAISSLGIHGAADDRVAQAILGETFPETGVYWVPGVSLFSENPEQF